MKTNMGLIDRVFRFAFAAAVLVLYLNHAISGTLFVILAIVALIFLVTSLVGFCPLYAILRISTKGKKK